MKRNQSFIELFDVVALTRDLPGTSMSRGQVGTVVEELTEGMFLIEFSDHLGVTYALAPVPADTLLVLHYHPKSEVAA